MGTLPLGNLPHIERRLTVFIAGGTGFVGRELVVRLVRQGHLVRVATRNARRADDLLPLSSVEVLPGNVYSLDFLRRGLTGCDLAVNLVGVLNARGAGGAGFRRAHVEFTAALLAAMAEAGVQRLLHVSALHADASHGASHYLRSKGAAEQLVRGAAPALEWTLFRPSLIFGPGDSLTRRFAALLQRTAGWLPLACADARFAPVYVGNVIDAMTQSLTDRATIGETYALCGPEALTLGEIVRLTAEAAGLPCHLVPVPAPLGWLQAAAMEWVPGKPFSLDNYRSLRVGGVCDDGGALARLGITPATLAALAPLWLSTPQSVARARESRLIRRTAA